MEPIEEPGGRCEKAAELKLLWALIERYDRSPPSHVDVEKAMENACAKLMLLEGRLRAQASGGSGTRPSEERCEEHDLSEEIRALREAVAELRARANPGESGQLAQGLVLPRKP